MKHEPLTRDATSSLLATYMAVACQGERGLQGGYKTVKSAGMPGNWMAAASYHVHEPAGVARHPFTIKPAGGRAASSARRIRSRLASIPSGKRRVAFGRLAFSFFCGPVRPSRTELRERIQDFGGGLLAGMTLGWMVLSWMGF